MMLRVNYLVLLKLLFVGLFVANSAQVFAQRIELESAVIESQSGDASAISKNNGEVATFFSMQKKIVYDTLRGIGIAVESLPSDVQASLARFHTQNFEAFRAFSSGLDALDDGRFAEAKSFFERAAEFDPDFTMARDLQFSMPQTNTYSGAQLQSALRDASRTATTAGKTSVEIDASRAVAALLSGQSVVGVTKGASAAGDVSGASQVGPSYTSNLPGSADQFAPRTVVGMSYSMLVGGGVTVGVALTNDWSGGQVRSSGGVLSSVGDSAGFLATRAGASNCCAASATLSEGTVVHWGAWNSAAGASASVTVSGAAVSAPQLGQQVAYMLAPATVAMPTTGTATYVPVGGFLGGVSGNVTTNFVNRTVSINNLGFTASGLTFSGLNGAASYAASASSGNFSGKYSSGNCAGCTAFVPTSSAFSGNFVGGAASGLVYSSIMQTGNGTVSGLQLFGK
jgi:hypothetical protein